MSNQAVDQKAFYRPLDDATLSRFHWRTVLTAGMGFFTDAYDLFIIGTVTAILTPIWHLTTGQLMWLNSTSLLASVLGALVFGRLMDLLGRKAMYGVEVVILTLGAIVSAFSGNVLQLIILRAVVGFAVGGDYATSAVITSEYANRKDRGRMIGTVFAMQGFGLLAGPAVAAILLASGIPHDLAWRLMLGLGAIPAASVIYLRRKIKETPRFTLGVRGDVGQTAATVQDLTGETVETRVGTVQTSRRSLLQAPYLLRLIGTAGSWFLMDIAFYGNSVSSSIILKALLPKAPLLETTLISAGIFLIAAVPGYWVAVALIDRIGRRRIQWQGFAVMAAAYGLIFLVPGIVKLPFLFLAVYGVSYFFIEFGPNQTTFVYPAEIFPVDVRGMGDGISAAGGKTGAFLGAFLMPLLVADLHLPATMGILAGASLLGALLTLVALPEPKQQTLEEASGEIATHSWSSDGSVLSARG